jgi:hypothetical protein
MYCVIQQRRELLAANIPHFQRANISRPSIRHHGGTDLLAILTQFLCQRVLTIPMRVTQMGNMHGPEVASAFVPTGRTARCRLEAGRRLASPFANKDCFFLPHRLLLYHSFPFATKLAPARRMCLSPNHACATFPINTLYNFMPENPQVCLWDEWDPLRAGVFRGRQPSNCRSRQSVRTECGLLVQKPPSLLGGPKSTT